MLDGDAHTSLVGLGCAHSIDLPVVTIDGDRAMALCHATTYAHGPDGFRPWRGRPADGTWCGPTRAGR